MGSGSKLTSGGDVAIGSMIGQSTLHVDGTGHGYELGFIPVTKGIMKDAVPTGLTDITWTKYYWCALIGLGVTILLVAFNYWFFEHTLLGKKLQATSQDKEMASLLGISVSAMIMITFVYSALLGGLAGILVAPILFVSIQMGGTIALKAFAATIIGGFGDVAGAIIGGLALGIIETFGAAYVSVPYKDGFAFLVLVAFLVFRPQGIFGERVAEKA